MGKILRALAADQLDLDSKNYTGNAEYESLQETCSELEDHLLASFDDEQKKLMEEYMNARIDADTIYGDHRFICGLKLGLLLMAETMIETYSL